jgi:hypothetical protein
MCFHIFFYVFFCQQELKNFFYRVPTTVPNLTGTSKQCCGSESEIIPMFWLDPNPNKKFGFGYGFGFRHCCRMKIFVKKSKIKHL